jgi:aminoglycoside phosphotransferase (APT) family kinase protein
VTRQPPAAALRWAAGVLGAGVTARRGLREGGSPWLLDAGGRLVVLRASQRTTARQVATEAAGLARGVAAGVPVPELLGHDDGMASGVPALLASCLPGDSSIPVEPAPARLRALGAAAAKLHAVPCQPSEVLPRREHPIGDEDFAALRAGHDVGPLQRAAQAALEHAVPAREPAVLVHGDLWQGNALFTGDVLAGLVDWDCAGAGAPGVDLGSLRMDAAFCYGAAAAAEVTAGWEQEAGRAAVNVAYWDLVAALATPPGLGWFPDAIASAVRRPDLTRDLLLRRHEEFLSRALEAVRSG